MTPLSTYDTIKTFITRLENRHFGPQWFAARSPEYAKSIKAFGDAVTADQVKSVVESTAGVDLHCNECKSIVPKVIVFEANTDSETVELYVCVDCLRKALAELEAYPIRTADAK